MTRNDWIPVKERLPEKEEAYYWVTTSYGKIVDSIQIGIGICSLLLVVK